MRIRPEERPEEEAELPVLSSKICYLCPYQTPSPWLYNTDYYITNMNQKNGTAKPVEGKQLTSIPIIICTTKYIPMYLYIAGIWVMLRANGFFPSTARSSVKSNTFVTVKINRQDKPSVFHVSYIYVITAGLILWEK